MRDAEFTSQRAGKLVRNLDGQTAFLAAELPPRLTWSASLSKKLGQAEFALGRLSGVARNLPNLQPIIRFSLRREAELSSRIEGTQAGVETVAVFEHAPAVAKRKPDVQEVYNSFRAIEYGVKELKRRRISLSLIKELHQTLLRDVRGHDKTPGAFRTIQAHIGTTARIQDARFVPAPPMHVLECMQQLADYIEQPDELPSIIRAALVHYQFEAIHPFADGNGRVGRMIVLLLLMQENAMEYPLLNPSTYLERNRRAYYDHLLNVSQGGEWESWIEFFLDGVTEEALHAITRVERLDNLRKSYLKKVQTARRSALLPRLVELLFADPAVTINQVAESLDIGYTSAKKLVERLLDVQILRQARGGLRDRVFIAPGILRQFDLPESNPTNP